MKPALPTLAYTKRQAASMLNITESGIDWLIRSGKLPHRKIARKIRFTKSDLQGLIDACAVTQCCAAEKKGV